MKNIICVIPARGGSKRIPGKNIKLFRNKPIISWSIDVAKKSNIFSRIIVSSDDRDIIAVANQCGAETPFIRPTELADDFSDTKSVIQHAIAMLKEMGEKDLFICCLYATSPFTIVEDIRKADKKIGEKKDTFVFPVTTYSYPIERALTINSLGQANAKDEYNANKRSQDFQDNYHDAGQFYIAHENRWLGTENIFKNSEPLIIPRWRVQDIDNIEDWKRAEIMHDVLTRQGLLNN